MPRNLQTEKRRVETQVEEYLRPVFGGKDDGRGLSLLSVSKALHVSRMTLRKHDISRRLVEATRYRNGGEMRQNEKDILRAKVTVAQREAAEWKARHDGLLAASSQD